MKAASRHRYAEALAIFARAPGAACQYALSALNGSGPPQQLDFGSVKLWVRPGTTDLKVVRSCLLGEFDPVLDIIQSSEKLIVDAGGYIGLTSILFARRFPDSQIVCLEPNAENYAIAVKNCAGWPNIEVLQAALAPEGGVVQLKDRGTGHWGFTIAAVEQAPSHLRVIGEVGAVTIDEIMSRFGRSGIDLLKLDIEGGEYALLKDRPAWVAQCGVIVAEMHDRICSESTRAFINATEGRVDFWAKGEKRISLHPDIAAHAGAVAKAA